MAGGYSVPPTGDLGVLVQRLEDTERRLRELEMPTGSQVAEAVANLADAQAEIAAQQALVAQMRTYSTTGGSAYQTGGGVTNYTAPATVTFTVDRPMIVLLQLLMPFEFVAENNTTAQVFGTYTLTGPGASGAVSYLFNTNVLAAHRGNSQGAAVKGGLVGAGTHTFGPLLAADALVSLSGGTPGIHFVRGTEITAVVSVIGEQ